MNTNFGKIHQRISIWTVFTCCLFLTTSLVGAQERTWLFETAIKKRSLAQNLTVASITGVSGNGTVKLKGIEEMMIVNTLEYLHFVSVTSDLMVSGLNYGSDYSFNPVIAKVLDQQLLPDDGLLVEVEIEAFLEDQFISEVDMRSLVGRVLSGLTEQLKFNLQKNNYDFFIPLSSVEVLSSLPTLSPTAGTLVVQTASPTTSPETPPSTSVPSMTQVTSTPTSSPSMAQITSTPTSASSLSPTTPIPTALPSLAPVTSSPTVRPSVALVETFPTFLPSTLPTASTPTKQPSLSPITPDPTEVPTHQPILSTAVPTLPKSDPTSTPPSLSPTNFFNSLDPTKAFSTPPSAEQSMSPIQEFAPTGAPLPLATAEPSTKPPTMLPSNSPSISPTSLTPPPSKKDDVDFSIQLYPVASIMTIQTQNTFRKKMEEFLSEIFADLERPVTIENVEVLNTFIVTRTRYRRSLEEFVLQADMRVTGTFIPKDENDYVDLARSSLDFLTNYQDDFITSLQNSDRNEDAVYFANIQTIRDANVTPSPSPQPNIFPSVAGDSGLSAGVISGIVIGGLVVLLLLVGILVWPRRGGKSRRKESGPKRDGATSNKKTSKRKRKFFAPLKKKELPTQDPSQPSQRQQSKYSDASHSENDSVGLSELQSHFGAETIAGNDTMSYAYSLDHGIDPSVSSANTGYYTQNSFQAAGGGSALKSRKGDGANQVQRECFAPPGKLGVVIDTTPEGPVVHKVNPGSPLEGVVWPGDIIVAIDDQDTRLLSATEITALMVKNMNQRRKLSVVSDAL